MPNSSSNRLILKNTLFLYARMIFSMLVSLYTSRVVLDVLGVSDYGIYNVIGSLVILISLLSGSMASATQRFITFELGKGNSKEVNNVFSMSIIIHFCIAILVVILGETLGVYYIFHYLNVQPDRLIAAFWVFQASLLTVFINIVRVPYYASIIAYEKMSFFAWISIAEVVLQLVNVLILSVIPCDKLILYAFLIFATTALCAFGYRWYCRKNFDTCNYYFYVDKGYFGKMISFVGWNFVGALATTGTQTVVGMILNYMFSSVVNAACGVANKVSSAISGFVNNFQMAFTPQIVKLYAQNQMDSLFELMNRTALLSYYLLFILAVPLCVHIDLVLSIWLVEVPEYSGIFVILLMVYNLIDTLQAPFWKVITATGNIKVYEIWLNIVLVLNIPISYIFLKMGYPPYVVAAVSAGLNFLSAVIRTIHVKIQVCVPIATYFSHVICRSFVVSMCYLVPCMFLKKHFLVDDLFSFIFFYAISFFYIGVTIYIVGIKSEERLFLKELVRQKLHLFHKESK